MLPRPRRNTVLAVLLGLAYVSYVGYRLADAWERARVYPGAAPGVIAPIPTYKPEPEYTDQAKEAKVEGLVRLRLVVSPNGRPRGIRVLKSLGLGLDENAVEAIRRWRFEPGTKDGKPAYVEVFVDVGFHVL